MVIKSQPQLGTCIFTMGKCISAVAWVHADPAAALMEHDFYLQEQLADKNLVLLSHVVGRPFLKNE